MLRVRRVLGAIALCACLVSCSSGTGSFESGGEGNNDGILGLPPNPHGQYDGYSTKTVVDYNYRDWMSRIPDDVLVTEMSIPGSDEPVNHSPYGLSFYRAQAMVTYVQLNAGLRAFDLLLAAPTNPSSGGIYQLRPVTKRGAVLAATNDEQLDPLVSMLPYIRGFLASSPTETVILKITCLVPPQAPSGYLPCSQTTGTDNWYTRVAAMLTEAGLPLATGNIELSLGIDLSLGALRGKVLLVRDGYEMNVGGQSVGVDISTFNQYLPAKYPHMTSNADLYSVWREVKERLKFINELHSLPRYSADGAITYLSAESEGSFLYFMASGFDSLEGHPLSTGRTTSLPDIYPDFIRAACTAKKQVCTVYFTGLNWMLSDAMAGALSPAGDNNVAMRSYKNLGIILADYPGQALIKDIINSNRRITNPL